MILKNRCRLLNLYLVLDLNYFWTVWFDRDSPNNENPNDIESLNLLKSERQNEICDNPLYIQAKTKYGVSKQAM